MERLSFAVFVALLLVGQPLWAAEPQPKVLVPDEYHMDSPGQRPTSKGKSSPAAKPEYLSPASDVALTPKERQAVKMAQDWESSGAAPVQANGKVMFVHGASSPTVIGAPLQICDVELQPGETVNEVIVGDSARWMLEIAKAGNTTHVIIKPVDAGLVTSAVITTDKRVYHLKLISQRTGHTPHVGFLYHEDNVARYREKEAKEAKEKEWKTVDVDGQPTDLSKLNFGYEIKGDAPWKPIQVYDDGRQMFIKLPSSVQSGDAPILLARNGGQDTLVNFRMKNQAMIVDGVFPESFMISGVGSKQQRITIRKSK